MIWKIYRDKYGVDGEMPADDGGTAAEIKECCQKAYRLKTSLKEAASYIVPVAKSAAEQIRNLPMQASGKHISASTSSAQSRSRACNNRVHFAGLRQDEFSCRSIIERPHGFH